MNVVFDPLFTDTVHNNDDLSKFKISIRDTSAILHYDTDGLWCDESITFEIDLSDLESLLDDLENLLDPKNV